MPQGNADIKRPNYGAQTSEQPQKGSRRASFGGMGAGAVKGGGSGMTAGGDIKFDLSIGKTDMRGANMQDARIGQLGGMGNKMGDANQSDVDASVTDNSKRTLNLKTGNSTASTKTTTPAGTPSRRKTTPAPGSKTTGSKAPGTESSAPSSRSTASSRSTSGAASIRDIGEGFMSGGSKLTGAPVNIGRNRIDSDNIRRESTTRTTSTDVRASGSGKASADTKSVDARKSIPMSKKGKTAKTETKPAEPTNASTPKEEPKKEAATKQTIKQKATKSVAKGAAKVAAKATTSKKTSKKEEEE